MGVALVTILIVLGLILPYNVAVVIGAISDTCFRVDGLNSSIKNEKTNGSKESEPVVEDDVTHQGAMAEDQCEDAGEDECKDACVLWNNG
ncbi:hypothetical protein COCNU_04G007940 [Cocos nucifera]|uniref:Uncharacterized protein n=1 Tax=Cocos nucifera TaxID=13894 RepID=A0A8K0I6X8_COCNU|nr:hypothetical protein COCNU_04G007940 [Cocos nucifera]